MLLYINTDMIKVMSDFKRISIQEAKALIDSSEVMLIDIRDELSYQNGHIENATFLNNSNVKQFISSIQKDQSIIVYCYHGNSSQSAAQFLNEQGFADVYSMDGGFEEWRTQYNAVKS